MKHHLTTEAAAAQLEALNGPRFLTLMQHGSMSVEYYKPKDHDPQQPHEQDELYVVIAGSGMFFRNGARITFVAGDLLFVPAGMEHRFETFTEDFATWVIFYGPGGESAHT